MRRTGRAALPQDREAAGIISRFLFYSPRGHAAAGWPGPFGPGHDPNIDNDPIRIASTRQAGQIAGMDHDQQHPIDRLNALIESRRNASEAESYTAKLLAKGRVECAKKLGEEAVETALAAATSDRTAVIRESADLLYHLLVLWVAAEIEPDEVYAELRARESQSGLQEKLKRNR